MILKIAIVGYGKLGAAHHKVFNALNAEVVATCNRSVESNSRAKKAGIHRVYDDIGEMMLREDLDGVVCSPAMLNNYKVCGQLIPYQVPILLEKPPGTTDDQLESLITAAEKYNTKVMVATNRIWYSNLKRALNLIGGKDGIRGVTIQWSENPGHLRNTRKFSDEMIRTRSYSNTIHGFSILDCLCGDIQDFKLHHRRSSNQFEFDISLHGISERGVLSTFITSWSNPIPWRLSFYGNGYHFDFSPLETCTCTNLSNRSITEIQLDEYDKSFKPGLYAQNNHFLNGIQSGNFDQSVQLSHMPRLFKYASAITKQIS